VSGVLIDATLRAAERVATVLDDAGVPSLVIGALALAAHHHPRATSDLDLAIATHPKRLNDLAAALRAAGFDDVELRLPDANDPLAASWTSARPARSSFWW
jgi:hypothetical protein